MGGVNLGGILMSTNKHLNNVSLGIDIGSTTLKMVLIDKDRNILFSEYERHFADIQGVLLILLKKIRKEFNNIIISPTITGSGGLSISKYLNTNFTQEVIAVTSALKYFEPKTDVAIELGGEDAKIIYLGNTIEQRMNGICAGGTGSFIDQMATLLNTDAEGLNMYAKDYESIYQIASRCGVFAKSDIQPLINDGATKEDLSASIFQAVVNQTISGLAQGKPIRGNVAFLGGPLHFLEELKLRFIETLKLEDNEIINPSNSHLYAALGAAFNSNLDYDCHIDEMIEKLELGLKMKFEVSRMPKLFEDEEEYKDFKQRHALYEVSKKDINNYQGNIYLGIDAGSTTTKVALVDDDGALLYSFYSNNNGNPIKTVTKSLKEISEILPDGVNITYSCSTGYGEALVKSGFQLDEGEVETIAHYYAAAFFNPEVDCIIDIGGQDMKCIKIKNGSVDSVMLNEACSSGCGSFIETFAKGLDYEIEDFAEAALFAKNPIDLGSRCTVFMNSNVKQAQKEGASVADISAGLAYSVVKNALYKVIKVVDAKDLGDNIVVQGGTFYNEAVLRSFEMLSNTEVVRPDISGIMGAFGAALIAKERYENKKTSMLSISDIMQMEVNTEMSRCKLCANNCQLTINEFSSGVKHISGNRCERPLGINKTNQEIPNLYAYKLRRTFKYSPLKKEDAYRGTIGIPRVLNMYENYPFWATFLKELGYQVVLSPISTHKIYELGIDSIPSESECYPAKLVHGHIMYLLNKGIKTIFYPNVVYEHKEFEDSNNNFNCPIVATYSENIINNVDELKSENITYINPFLSLNDERQVEKRLIEIMSKYSDASKIEIKNAVKAAFKEKLNYEKDIKDEGERAIKYVEENNLKAIVLAGRPYHTDPGVHHGIPDLIAGFNVAVLTEDSVSHLSNVNHPLKVVDQWVYHSRLYRAATFAASHPNLNFVQLNSFGCGLDAVSTDVCRDIIEDSNKIYTSLKIDEINNLGAARIRIRSLLSADKDRSRKNIENKNNKEVSERVIFTKEMRDTHTFLFPQMSPFHFSLIEEGLKASGYKAKVLGGNNQSEVDLGLRFVNNDACYPAIIVVGQIMDALNSGEYDLDKVVIAITQTGGGCRATNYINFIRRALENANMKHIPVVSINAQMLEKNPGLVYTPKLITSLTHSLIYGDLLMRLVYKTRPYEKSKGSVNELHKKWEDKLKLSLHKNSWREYKKNIYKIVKDFDEIELNDENKIKVGVVGEILVKFLPAANNNLVELLEKEGAEAVVPDLLDFFLYSLYNANFKTDKLGFSKMSAFINNSVIKIIDLARRNMIMALEQSKRFDPPVQIATIAKSAEKIVSLGNQTGEGWFLTGEMMELIDSGVNNIVCAQPFACLPNHIVGKGVIKKIKELYPNANITPIDYDPGASEVNQLNRIKLMLSASEHLQ